MMKRKKIDLLFLIIWILLFSGCGSRPFMIRPAPEVTRMNRIAVFPLQNLSGIPEAGSRVTHILVSSLYNANLIDLVDPGEVQQFIIRSRIRTPGDLGLDAIRDASHQLGADGVIFGSVNDYNVIKTDRGDLPAVSITLRLVDADSGEIVWAVTHSLQGNFREKVFGIGRIDSAVILSEIVVEELIQALGVAMYPEEERFYSAKIGRTVKGQLLPEKPDKEPVLPTAPTRDEIENIELERERAHSAVKREWETIKSLSEADEKEE